MQEHSRTSALPELSEGQMLSVSSCEVKEGKTTPPKHFTEDTLLSAMETAGKEDMPEDAERRGLGTPATRAAVIEKLVATGFAERRKAKKSVRLVPTEAGVSLITVLPEQLQSPLLTAEWEHRLKEIECGELGADEFLDGIQRYGRSVWFGTLRLWTARRCCSPPADPLWANAPAAAQRSRRAKTAISARDEAASSGCGGTTASLPPRRSA